MVDSCEAGGWLIEQVFIVSAVLHNKPHTALVNANAGKYALCMSQLSLLILDNAVHVAPVIRV